MGGSTRGKVPWCGHVHPIMGPPGIRALGHLEVVPWELGIGVTTEKDVPGRGQGASQRQLYKAGRV